MLRKRILILLGVCALGAAGAWADDVGYVDCNSHSEGTQLFGKPRKTPDTIGTLPCGERFTILVYGFFFSKVQTKDGQIGYIYSNMIAVDRGATSLQPTASAQPAGQSTASLQVASEKTKIPRTPPDDVQSIPAASARPQPAPVSATPAQVPATSAPVTSASVTNATGAAPSNAIAAPQAAKEIQPAPVQAATTSPAGLTTPATTTTEAVKTSNVAEAAQINPEAKPEVNLPAAAEIQPAPVQPGTTSPAGLTTPATASSATGSAANAAETATPAPEPNPPAPAPPQPAAAQPEPAQPAAPAIRPADTRDSWEKPRPSIRTAPLVELYGGYAFARMSSGGSGSNMNGALGSFGWNVKSWVQVVGDTSFSFQTVGTTKNVLYGNHFGARFTLRMRNRWGITPFVEGLAGGSSLKTTVSGVGGYTASTGSMLSYKAGGGVNVHPSRHWEIRLVDVDYYRTAFGTNLHQNNYWISTGVVLRLFGGGVE